MRSEPGDFEIDGPENHYAAAVADAIDDQDDEEDSDYGEEDSDKEIESEVVSYEETEFEDDSDGGFLRGE